MKARIFPGWWVVASVFLLLMTSSGLGFYGLAIYLDAITDEQELSTTAVSLATSLFFVISGVAGRFIAPLIERYDLRAVVALGAVIAAGSLAALGQIDNAASLFVVYAIFSVGFALSGLVPATTLVTRWFHARRSVALSVASTGLSVGGLTFTRAASWLIDREGLADAAPWLALAYVAAAGLALLAMWPDPAARGERPDGIDQSPVTTPASDGSVAYRPAVRSRFFKVISIGFLLAMGAQVGGIAQIAKLGTERIDRPTGALAVSAIAGASVVARLLGGLIASRVPIMGMTAVLAAVQSISLAMIAFADTAPMLVLSALLFGATIGNLLMLQPLVIAEAFGIAAYPRIFALEQLVVTAGVALGPFLLGALRDASGYRLSYLVAAAMSSAGALVMTQSGHWRPTPAAFADDSEGEGPVVANLP